MNDWKTTLAGALAASAHLWANGADWKQILAAAAIAALGYFAKDGGKSGNEKKPNKSSPTP